MVSLQTTVFTVGFKLGNTGCFHHFNMRLCQKQQECRNIRHKKLYWRLILSEFRANVNVKMSDVEGYQGKGVGLWGPSSLGSTLDAV